MSSLACARALALLERDRGLVWHPYAPLDGPPQYAVLDASGTRLVLEEMFTVYRFCVGGRLAATLTNT